MVDLLILANGLSEFSLDRIHLSEGFLGKRRTFGRRLLSAVNISFTVACGY